MKKTIITVLFSVYFGVSSNAYSMLSRDHNSCNNISEEEKGDHEISGIANIFKVHEYQLKNFINNTSTIYCMCASKNGNHVVVGYADGEVVLFDITKPESIRVISSYKHLSAVRRVSITADGQIWASGDCQGNVKIKKQGIINTINYKYKNAASIHEIMFSHDNTILLVRDFDKNIICLHLGSTKDSFAITKKVCIRAEDFSSDNITKIATDKNMQIIAVGFESGVVAVYDKTGKEIHGYGHKRFVTALRVSFDGRYVFSVGEDGALMVWDLKSTIQPLFEHTQNEGISCMHVTDDNICVVFGDISGRVCLYNFVTNKSYVPGCYDGAINSLEITEDQEYLFIVAEENIFLYDLIEKKDIAKRQCPRSVRFLCPTNIGRCFAAGGHFARTFFTVDQLCYSTEQKSIKIKNACKKELLSKNMLLQRSSDCRRFISGAQDGTLILCENPSHVSQRNMRLKNKKRVMRQRAQDQKDRIEYVINSDEYSSQENNNFNIYLQHKTISIKKDVFKLFCNTSK